MACRLTNEKEIRRGLLEMFCFDVKLVLDSVLLTTRRRLPN